MYQLNLSNSVVVMLVGMSIVFTFLVILVLSIQLSHRIIHGLGLDKEPEPENKPTAAPDNKGVVAAITAAVKLYEAEK